MKYKILNKNYLKRNIVIVALIIGIISVVILNFTRTKHRITESISLVNGHINYKLSDLNLIGVYIEDKNDYTKVNQIPDSGYIFNSEKSYCQIDNKKQDMTITYDMNTKNLTIAPMTTKGTKCYLYFDKQKISLEDAIKRDNAINNELPNFANPATTNEGLYKTEDDWGESYYFRGDINNNWVLFAGFYWRIIRINGDGSIRLIYNGESTTITGDSTMIENSQIFNDEYNRSEYVGYMYITNEQHGNATNSNIKIVIDDWYTNNLANYASQISMEAGFCGDREIARGYLWSSIPNDTIYYATQRRLTQNSNSINPTLKCSNSSDLYTVSESSKGNHALNNPIGLITADEVSMAGGVYGTNNSDYYLYTKQYYWTMSPFYFSPSYTYPTGVFIVDANGWLDGSGVRSAGGVRPVINLTRDVIIKSGNGTSSTPYEI